MNADRPMAKRQEKTKIATTRSSHEQTGSTKVPSLVIRRPGEAAVALHASSSGAMKTASTTDERDPYALTATAEIIDRSLHASAARFTAGLSPAAFAAAYWDWATHLAFAPGKRMLLADKAA